MLIEKLYEAEFWLRLLHKSSRCVLSVVAVYMRQVSSSQVPLLLRLLQYIYVFEIK